MNYSIANAVILSAEVPYTMPIKEAAAYFNIGEKKLRQLVEENRSDNLYLINGDRKVMIKTYRLAQFLDKVTNI